MGGEERRGTVAVLSPVTNTDVWGGKEDQEEDRGKNGGGEKVKETTFEKEMAKKKQESNTDK